MGYSLALVPGGRKALGLSSKSLEASPYNRVVEAAEEGLAEVFGERGEGGHGVDGRGEATDFEVAVTGFEEIEGGEVRGDGALVRGVEIEVRSEDGEALGVGGLEDGDGAGAGLGGAEVDEFGEERGRQVLDDLAAEDGVE